MSDYDKENRAKKYLLTDESYRKKLFIGPTYLNLLGNTKGKSIVDIGCGSGFSSRLIKKSGAKSVTGIDKSKKQIFLANEIEKKEKYNINYLVGNIASTSFFSNNKFDIAGAELLLHNAKTKKELFIMCKNISLLLKKGGKFVMVNQDPVNFKLGKIRFNEKYAYSGKKDGSKIKCTLYTNSKRKICSVTVYHWNKDVYEQALIKFGFTNIKWYNLTKSKDADLILGKKRADEFMQALPSVGLSCTKK